MEAAILSREASRRQFLEHYAQRLNSVEINYTFRRMPSAATLEKWVAATPPGFVFALKGHMRITHIMRLKNAAKLRRFSARHRSLARGAAAGAGAVPASAANEVRHRLLRAFLEILPDDLRYAFEFRHTSWLVHEVYCLLEGRNISLCVAESEKLECPK